MALNPTDLFDIRSLLTDEERMIQDAVAENELEARHSLEYAMSIEMIHAKLFKKALEDPKGQQQTAYYICPVCGNTTEGKPPKKCPYCGVDEKEFVEVT